jgi:hypothetical protein
MSIETTPPAQSSALPCSPSSDTPETEAATWEVSGGEIQRKNGVRLGGGYVVDADFSRKLERERNEWKAKYIQQNKDLGCELMDPNGTIWDHAEKLQTERDRLRTALSEIVACGRNCKDALDEAEQMEAIALCALNYCENTRSNGATCGLNPSAGIISAR